MFLEFSFKEVTPPLYEKEAKNNQRTKESMSVQYVV